MQEGLKSIGKRLQEMFSGVVRRPLGWKEIDKLADIDEREEAMQANKDKDAPPRR
jgi:hypothetical protein